MQRVEQPIMITGLERIAAKSREKRKLKFTSLAHHLTEALVWESVCHIPTNSAPGCDEQTATEAKETFKQWAPDILRAIHQQGYRPPPVLRVFIPKPGRREKRPLGIPCVADISGTATQCGQCPCGDLRTRFPALLVWWSVGIERSSRAGNADGSHRGKARELRVRSRFEELFRQSRPRMATAFSRRPSRRPTYNESD
jgi:hypothetical protein